MAGLAGVHFIEGAENVAARSERPIESSSLTISELAALFSANNYPPELCKLPDALAKQQAAAACNIGMTSGDARIGSVNNIAVPVPRQAEPSRYPIMR